MKKYLLNFADKNYELQQKLQIVSTKDYFDEIISVSPDDIEPDFKEKNKAIFNFSKGSGYWLWKAYFISRSLDYIANGDILFYVDSGNEFIRNPSEIFKLLDSQDIILFNNRDGHPTGDMWKNSTWTKADCFNLMGCNDEKYKQGHQVDGAYILLKKTENSIKFVNEYLKWSCNKNVITDMDNVTGKNEDDFRDHRHDQSILSLLAIKYGLTLCEAPCQHANHVTDRPYNQILNHFRKNISWSIIYNRIEK